MKLVWSPVLDDIFVLLLFLDLDVEGQGICIILSYTARPLFYFSILLAFGFPIPFPLYGTILLWLIHILSLCMILQTVHCSVYTHLGFMKMVFHCFILLLPFLSAVFCKPSMYYIYLWLNTYNYCIVLQLCGYHISPIHLPSKKY